MLTLRELLSPIPDAALRGLAQHKRRGAVLLATLVACSDTLGNGINVLAGISSPVRSAVNVVLNVVVCASVVAAARRRRRAEADAELFVLALLIIVNFASDGWVRNDGKNDLLPYAVLIPPLVAAFAPWRPIYSIALGVVGAAGTLGGHAAGIVALPTDPVSHSVMCFIAGMGGAAGAQLQRRLWFQLEGARAQLAASERMTSLGRTTAGVAHELKSPLAAAMNATEELNVLATELENSIGHPEVTNHDLREIVAELRESLGLVGASVSRSTQFIQALRAHTVQLECASTSTFDVSTVIQSSLTLLAHEIRRQGVVVDASGVDVATTCGGDPGKLGQIVTNLVGNAIDACAHSPSGARVAVSAATTADGVVLVVADDGPGVPEAMRDRIFDLLFTTKAAHGGTGLGLALSRDIAEGTFGGTLRLVPSERGARFELRIPRAPASASRGSLPMLRRAAWSPAEAPGATEHGVPTE